MKYIFMVMTLTSFSFLAQASSENGVEDYNSAMKKLEKEMKETIKKAQSCSKIIKRICGTEETMKCLNSVKNKIPGNCRKMISNLGVTSGGMSSELKLCTNRAIKKCKMPKKLGEDYPAMAKYQSCLEKAMKSDENCTDMIKERMKGSTDNSEAYREMIK